MLLRQDTLKPRLNLDYCLGEVQRCSARSTGKDQGLSIVGARHISAIDLDTWRLVTKVKGNMTEHEHEQPKPRQFSRHSQGTADMGKLRRKGCTKYA